MANRSPFQWLLAAALSAMAASFGPSSIAAAPAHADEPETVMVTLHAKPGSEADVSRVMAKHWETARRLNLVQTRRT
jgi:hypothetical protein